MSERLIIVHNPNSSRAKKVASEVFNTLDNTSTRYTAFETKSPNAEDNIADMSNFLEDGDTVVVAASDGTAMQAGNAILRSEHTNSKIGLLPYGNFNDLARVYGLSPNALTNHDSLGTTNLYPLVITANETYCRDALAYATAGWTARAAREFSEHDSRESIVGTPDAIKLTRSLWQLAINYFAHRNEYLPPFHTSRSEIVKQSVTDIVAVNNPMMGTIIRSDMPYSSIANIFGYTELDVSSFTKNIPFGLKAVSGHTPLDATEKIALNFTEPSTLHVQSEGEAFTTTETSTLTIAKDPSRKLNVLVGSK